MKKSEFKKLKVGDTVQLRTLDELEQLKCWAKGGVLANSGVIDDDGYFKDHVVTCYPELLGESGSVILVRDVEIIVNVGDCRILVVRQHLKGRE